MPLGGTRPTSQVTDAASHVHGIRAAFTFGNRSQTPRLCQLPGFINHRKGYVAPALKYTMGTVARWFVLDVATDMLETG